MKILCKKGFTLSETLITLGIIGVISVLTLPNLISNYKTKVYISQLQKVYNQISNAAASAIADERVDALDQTYIYEDADGAIDFLKKYLKVAKDCRTTPTDCFASSYKSLDKSASVSTSEMLGENARCVTLNTGAAICVASIYSQDGYYYHGGISFVIDVNGKSAPNINGRDLFQFEMYSDGVIGTSYIEQDAATSGERCAEWANSASYGGSCFVKIVADGWKMDY